MSQPKRRKITASPPRARRDSARLFDSEKKSSSTKKRTGANPGAQPMLWTKNASKNNAQDSLPIRILKGIAGLVAFLFLGLLKGIKAFFAFIVSLASRSKVALVVILLCAVFIVGSLLDLGLNWGKVYPGVKIGDLDVGGHTVEEVEKFVEDTYAPRLSSTKVYIFANEDASKDLEAALAQTNDQNYAEQHSAEEVQARKLVWEVDAASVGATLDTKGLVEDAMAYGRENGGIFERLSALFMGYTIDPRAHYDSDLLESLAADIDATMGDPMINYDISVIEGIAVVVEGHDGDMVDRRTLEQKLNESLLYSGEAQSSFVAKTEYTPMQITWEKAQDTCDLVNSSINKGAQFLYEGSGWNASAIDIGNWIKTKIIEGENGWELQPYLDYDLAKSTLLNHLKASFSGDEIKIRFSKEGDEIRVHSDTQGNLPQSQQAVSTLSRRLFQSDEAIESMPVIEVDSTAIPESLSFQEALDAGVVNLISDYTTEYAANVENRNHNIHLVSDLLDSSIVSSNGGIWSFNEIAGYCNEEAGFKGAGAIINDEYVDEIGGGICQVATTVFNSVYNAGYPIVQRYNHSLYISSYPAGLDAAVSWPDLDLQWKNDTSSDILVVTSYTDSTVTVALYGVDPGYEVSSTTGNWEEGKKFTTKTITDDTLAPGYSYTKSYGTNGSSITVVRTVKDKDGLVLHEDYFISTYSPREEVIVEGPKIVEPEKPSSEEEPSGEATPNEINSSE